MLDILKHYCKHDFLEGPVKWVGDKKMIIILMLDILKHYCKHDFLEGPVKWVGNTKDKQVDDRSDFTCRNKKYVVLSWLIMRFQNGVHWKIFQLQTQNMNQLL